MLTTFAGSLDALGVWRSGLAAQLEQFGRFLGEHQALDGTAADRLSSLRDRLRADKLIVAFAAEFSRGKSELINAIFFADLGRRVLPATPGRTTMCPVELGFDAGEPLGLSLLPIATRLEGRSLAELRSQPEAWTQRPFTSGSAEELAEALEEVTRTMRVTVDEARALGFWSDEIPEDNPPLDRGRADVPMWRHARINYRHPLLERGLVVLDTPGLNAIGVEPELTLGLLPSAHATVFVLGADTGVTKSDLSIWRDHLSAETRCRFVVMNKIDTLADPMAPPGWVAAQIERQRRDVARTLEVPLGRVFPVSARQALAGRVAGAADALAASRVAELEQALATQLLPQRRQLVRRMLQDGLQPLQRHLTRRLADRRRQLAEQVLELRGLRGKSGAKLRLMLERVDAEAVEFEPSLVRLQAMRAVHGRMLGDAIGFLAAEPLRGLLAEMQPTLLGFGMRAAFIRLCAGVREALQRAQRHNTEIHSMLSASFATLNSDHGFSLSLTAAPDLARPLGELDLIERNYVRYLGLGQAIRLAQPRFMEQFRRMLASRLRGVVEGAARDIEQWNKAASAQVEAQLRERREAFRRRRDSLERIQAASNELEQRIGEFEAQDKRLLQLEAQLHEQLAALQRAAAQPMPGDDAIEHDGDAGDAGDAGAVALADDGIGGVSAGIDAVEPRRVACA